MKALYSFVVVLVFAMPCTAGSIIILTPSPGDTVQTDSYVQIIGGANGRWPPEPSVVVTVTRQVGTAWEHYGYYTTQLDLQTGIFVTGFSPGLPGEYFLTATLYEGGRPGGSSSVGITVK